MLHPDKEKHAKTKSSINRKQTLNMLDDISNVLHRFVHHLLPWWGWNNLC